MSFNWKWIRAKNLFQIIIVEKREDKCGYFVIKKITFKRCIQTYCKFFLYKISKLFNIKITSFGWKCNVKVKVTYMVILELVSTNLLSSSCILFFWCLAGWALPPRDCGFLCFGCCRVWLVSQGIWFSIVSKSVEICRILWLCLTSTAPVATDFLWAVSGFSFAEFLWAAYIWRRCYVFSVLPFFVRLV
jgi:hypothetical protein